MKTIYFSFLLTCSLLIINGCKKEEIEEIEPNNSQTIRVVITEQNSNSFGINVGDTIDWYLEVNYSEEDWEYESKLILKNGLDTTFTFPSSPKIIDFEFEAEKDSQDWYIGSNFTEGKSHIIYVFDTISVQ